METEKKAPASTDAPKVTPPPVTELEVELINFGRLRDYSAGKIKEPLETFSLAVAETAGPAGAGKEGVKKDYSDGGEAGGLNDVGKKIKDLVTGKISLGGKKKLGPRVKYEAHPNGAAAGGIMEKLKKHLAVIILIILIAALLIGVIIFLPQPGQEGEGGWSALVNSMKMLLGRPAENPDAIIENPGAIGTTTPTPGTGALTTGTEPEPEEQSVDYSTLSVEKVIERGKVEELSYTKEEVPSAEGETPVATPLAQEDIYGFIRENAVNLERGKVYFAKINGSIGQPITLSEMVEAMGLVMLPALLNDPKDYRLMVYKEEEGTEPENKIRLGLLLLFDQAAAPAMAEIKQWEGTMITDLSPLYFDGNELLMDQADTFQDSWIDSNRRYLNFSTDDSLSLDYGVASDGIVVATSKNFGSAILHLLLAQQDEIDSI